MTTHDYTHPTWGHDVVIHSIIDDGQKLRVSGWGQGVRDGDYLILKNGGGTTRYQVSSIERPGNPPDMWHADLTFAPRAPN